MITPEDKDENVYFTEAKDGGHEYRKFSLKVNATDPEFPFSTCTSNVTGPRSETQNIRYAALYYLTIIIFRN